MFLLQKCFLLQKMFLCFKNVFFLQFFFLVFNFFWCAHFSMTMAPCSILIAYLESSWKSIYMTYWHTNQNFQFLNKFVHSANIELSIFFIFIIQLSHDDLWYTHPIMTLLLNSIFTWTYMLHSIVNNGKLICINVVLMHLSSLSTYCLLCAHSVTSHLVSIDAAPESGQIKQLYIKLFRVKYIKQIYTMMQNTHIILISIRKH